MEHLVIKMEPNESEEVSFIEQKISNQPTSEQFALKKEHHDKMKLLSELGNKVIQTAKASKASTSRNEYRRDTPMPVKEVLKLVENGINKLTQEHGKL